MSYESFEAHDAVTFDTITNLYWPLTAFGVKASYPSLDVALMEKTIDLQLDWVRARLDGKPWSSNCKSADTAPHETANFPGVR